MRSGLALSLIRAASLSVGNDALVAGLPLPRFLKILSSPKFPVVQGSAARMEDELSQARPWLAQPRGHDHSVFFPPRLIRWSWMRATDRTGPAAPGRWRGALLLIDDRIGRAEASH